MLPVNPVVGSSSEPWILLACLPCSALGPDSTRQSQVPRWEMLLSAYHVAQHTFQKGPFSSYFLPPQKQAAAPQIFLEWLRKQLFGWILGHCWSLTLRSFVNAPHNDTGMSDHVSTAVASKVNVPPPSLSLLCLLEGQFFFF